MGILSWLKTSEKAADTAIEAADGLINSAKRGLDVMFLTDQEKIEFGLKISDSIIRMHETQHDENSIRAQVRRSLATKIIYFWLLLIGVGVGCGLVGDTVRAEYVFRIVKDVMGFAVLSVIIFYFGYYGIMTAAKVFKK